MEETTMKTGVAMLLGAGALFCFAGLADGAHAAVSHKARHHRVTATQASETSDLSTLGNNPAKRAAVRQPGENSVASPTLMQSGNNPAKRYSTRHAPENAIGEQTLMTNGNNPAKKYQR